MSRNQKIRTLMAGCALILAAAVILAVSGIFGGIGYTYGNAEKYTSGETELKESIRNLEVGWVDGAVKIEYHAGNTILLRETSRKTIGEDMKMRWWLDGDTLRIRYAKPGLRLSTGYDKELTVTLPEGIALSEVSLEATSGDLYAPGLKAETLKLETTSGTIRAEAETASLRAVSTSGGQEVTVKGNAKEIRLESTSGAIALSGESAGELEANSTSGGVAVAMSGKADHIRVHTTSGGIAADVKESKELAAESTSGGISLRLEAAGEISAACTSGEVAVAAGKLDSLKVNSTSGTVTAALPEKPGFTANVHTASGKIENTVALTASGNEYSCGDGSAKAEISTTSGNVRIEAWQE